MTTGPELQSRFAALFEDCRRRVSLLAAPLDIRRIKPGPLLNAMASLMALGLERSGTGTVGSGSCNGVGGHEEGRLRPRGPSGDDCSEVYAGVDDNDSLAGLRAEAAVMLDDSGVMLCNADACWANIEGDWHCLCGRPLVSTGDDVPEGVMMDPMQVPQWFA